MICRVFSAGRRGGFTLVELLVVITVLGILAALVMGGAQSVIRSGRIAASLSNMKQLTGALLTFAVDNNNMLPSSGANIPTWDLQIFPYLGINDGYSGSPSSPQVKSGLDLKIYRCPLDQRNVDPAKAFYPRSYGITGTAINFANQNGGIVGRLPGEGMRLAAVPKPGQYVILCRVMRAWESAFNLVGAGACSAYNGPYLHVPSDWEAYRPIFGGKVPYGFADGHVALLNLQEALLVYPVDWDVNK